MKLLAFAASVLLCLPASPARAQGADPGKAGAFRNVGRTCRPYTERFCPELLQGNAPSPRAQALCLKRFKTSLSLGCRTAVTAASK